MFQPEPNKGFVVHTSPISLSPTFFCRYSVSKLSRQDQMWRQDLILIPYRPAALAMYKTRLSFWRHICTGRKMLDFRDKGLMYNQQIFKLRSVNYFQQRYKYLIWFSDRTKNTSGVVLYCSSNGRWYKPGLSGSFAHFANKKERKYGENDHRVDRKCQKMVQICKVRTFMFNVSHRPCHRQHSRWKLPLSIESVSRF